MTIDDLIAACERELRELRAQLLAEGADPAYLDQLEREVSEPVRWTSELRAECASLFEAIKARRW